MNIFSDPFIQFDTENLVEWGFEKKRILNLGSYSNYSEWIILDWS